MSLDRLPFNMFDLCLLVILICGILRGRKHGMSEELFGLVKWIIIAVACGLLYDPMGRFLAQSSPLGLLVSFIVVYSGTALVLLAFFALFKHAVGGKLIGSDVFGRSEYYLGMGSGLVRFSCMVVAGLALLNARYFPPAEVKAMVNFQNDVYGSNFFPTWHTAQEVVFEKSLTGPWIKKNLDFLLIKPTQPEGSQYHQQEWGTL